MKKILTLITATTLATYGSMAAATTISKEEVLKAQQKWADGIVAISQTYLENGDYSQRAKQHIQALYAYEQSDVLFKPTLASDDQFRETFDEALSYFVGGKIPEDTGFAIKPWSKARFGEQDIVFGADSAIAMGNYYFTPYGETKETKVEYTFGYIKDDEGNIRINVHHSSLPFAK